MSGVGFCDTCPSAPGRMLHELAGAYIPPEEWLFGTSDLGPFSVQAISTAAEYFGIAEDPASPSYGELQQWATEEETELWLLERNHGDNVTWGIIAKFRKAHAKRDKRLQKFQRLPFECQKQLADAARPLLERVAMDAFDDNPDVRSFERLAMSADTRSEKEDLIQSSRAFGDRSGSLERLHRLDQAVPMAARIILKACQGPWQLTQTRRTWRHPLKPQPHVVEVCPYSKPNEVYYKAYDQQKSQQ